MKYFILGIFLGFSLYANEIGIVKSVTGDVTSKNAKGVLVVRSGQSLDSGMVLFTKNDSSINILFKDNSTLKLGSNAILNLSRYIFEPTKENYDIELFLEAGPLSFESGKIGELSPEDFILKTPDGVVAIRGTKFFVDVK